MVVHPVPISSALIAGNAQAQQASQRPPNLRGLLIVDDHELVRLGLRALIQSQSPLGSTPVQVFEARTLASALETYATHQTQIDLVLLDLGLSDSQGLAGLATFVRRFPAAAVVVISGDSNPQTVQDAMALGAQAYLKKTGDLGEVIAYMQTQGLAPRSHAHSPTPNASGLLTDRAGALTARQLEILDWVLQGKSNREIGELAFLAEGTVKNHVSTLLLHFGAKSRAQLISAMR